MAKKAKEAIAVVLDIGKNVQHHILPDGTTFLEKSIFCIQRILERKILNKSSDEIGLILVGSEESKNRIDYDNIVEALPMSIPTWQDVEFVRNLETTNCIGDWLDGLITGMTMLKEESMVKKFTEKKVVLFTNCDSEVKADGIDAVLKGLKSENIEFIAIGLNIFGNTEESEGKHPTNPSSKSDFQLAGESLMKQIVIEVDGLVCNFHNAISQLLLYQTKSSRSVPWNVKLQIGKDISIPVSGYKRISDAKLPTWQITSSQNYNSSETTLVEKERSYFKMDEDQTPVEREEIISGYYFGSTLVPMSEDDKRILSYSSGNKCLTLLGFTDPKNVPRHYFVSNGVLYFVPQKGCKDAAVALSAIIRAMVKLNVVAIVRRVYNNNTNPYVGAMFPKIKKKFECLVYVELPYSEDVRQFVFKPLVTEKTKPSTEQLHAIDLLIDNMDLMSADVDEDGDPVESLKPKSTVDPYFQYVAHCLSQRALNPDCEFKDLPKELKKLLTCPFSASEGYEIALNEIKQQFTLEVQKPKEPRRKAADIFKQDEELNKGASYSKIDPLKVDDKITIAGLTSENICKVGTINPVQDFKDLIKKEQSFIEVSEQMKEVIMDLVYQSFGDDNFPKAIGALKVLRQECLERGPDIYNVWLPEFKEKILDRGKLRFWSLVVRDNLGLITCIEHPNSMVNLEEAKTFLELLEEAVSQTSTTGQSMDVEDLFDEM